MQHQHLPSWLEETIFPAGGDHGPFYPKIAIAWGSWKCQASSCIHGRGWFGCGAGVQFCSEMFECAVSVGQLFGDRALDSQERGGTRDVGFGVSSTGQRFRL